MTTRSLAACAGAALAAGVLAPAAAPAAPLIAPLDVRVEARVVPTTVLSGTWNVFATPDGQGEWRGANVRLTESWQPGGRVPLRIRGRASGGPRRTHYVQMKYLKARTGEGVLTEITDRGEPIVLQCAAQGAGGPRDTIVEAEQTAMQVVDDPRRNRVTVQGPGIAFLGPECRPAGDDRPVIGFGMHPPDPEANFAPEGALTPWRFTVPRAEFAAGGTFRFRGRYSYGENIENLTSNDVAGTQVTSGRVAVDLVVRRVGR
jgi:hypothetical protein